jgi:preprotein translocase subunit SecE
MGWNYVMRYPTVQSIFASSLKPSIMSLVTVLLVLIVVGVILWLINTYIPMDRKIKNILNIVVVILVVLWLLRAFGVLDSLNNVRI